MALFNELLSEPNAGDANISGVAIGVVKENWDSNHPGMVKVEISLGTSGKSLTDWTPVAVPYAGKQYGTYFLPEVGTQVLVAFHMGDINCPIVIGCMWNQKDIDPPAAANEKNTVKTIRTKGGNQIVISEESGKETITIETTGKQKLFLDDENKKISLQDEKGDNAIILDSKEGKLDFICKKKASFKINGKELLTLDGNGQNITLKTGKIQIEADQSVKLKGQKLSAEGGAAEIKGQSVKMESQTTLNIKGTASLKVESSGITEVKGSMVKVN